VLILGCGLRRFPFTANHTYFVRIYTGKVYTGKVSAVTGVTPLDAMTGTSFVGRLVRLPGLSVFVWWSWLSR